MSFDDPIGQELTNLILFADEELVFDIDELLCICNQILVGLVN